MCLTIIKISHKIQSTKTQQYQNNTILENYFFFIDFFTPSGAISFFK